MFILKSEYLIFSVDKIIRFINPYILSILFSFEISDKVLYINLFFSALISVFDFGSLQQFTLIKSKKIKSESDLFFRAKTIFYLSFIGSFVIYSLSSYEYKFLIFLTPLLLLNRLTSSIYKSINKNILYFIFEFLLPSSILLLSILVTYLLKILGIIEVNFLSYLILIWISFISIINFYVIFNYFYKYKIDIKLLLPNNKLKKFIIECKNLFNSNSFIFFSINSLPFLNSILQSSLLVYFFKSGSLTIYNYIIILGGVTAIYQTVINQRDQYKIANLDSIQDNKKLIILYENMRKESFSIYLFLQILSVLIFFIIKAHFLQSTDFSLKYILIVSYSSLINIITGSCSTFLQYLKLQRTDLKITVFSTISSIILGILLFKLFNLTGIYIWFSLTIIINNLVKFIYIKRHLKLIENINLFNILLPFTLFLLIMIINNQILLFSYFVILMYFYYLKIRPYSRII